MNYKKKSFASKKAKRVYKPKRKSVKAKSFKLNIKRVVKQVISRAVEVKCQMASFTLNPTCLQVGTSSLAGNFYIINPSNSSTGYTIGRGTNNTQMIGNKVSLASCILKYTISPNAYNATTNPSILPFYARVFFYKYKNTPDQDPAVADTAGGSGTLFENGPSYTGFTGALMDLNRRINRENFVYLGHKTFKIGQSEPQNGATVTSSNLSASNNDFKLSHFGEMNLTKFCPKTQILNDNLTWQDDRIIMMWQVVTATAGFGTYAPNTVTPCNIQCQIEYKFRDM